MKLPCGVLLLSLLWSGHALAALQVTGSSASLHLLREVATYFSQDANIPVRVAGGGSDAGAQAVREGRADIGIAARPLAANEARILLSRSLGVDGIALIVHQNNPLTAVTHAQVHELFEGRLSQWRELGIDTRLGPTVPVLRSPTRAARQQFDAHFGVSALLPPRSVELGSDLAVLLYVSSDPEAIGYISIGTLAEAQQRGLKVRGLLLDGVEPTARNCAERRYPLCRPLVVLTKGPARGEAKQFLDFLFSPAGRAIVERHGFALPAEEAR